MGHRAVARVAESFAFELLDAGDVGARDDAPAHHGVGASDDHAIVRLRIRRPADDQRTAAADHDRSIPTAGVNKFLGYDNTAAARDIRRARRNKLLDVETVLLVNPRLIGSHKRHLVERNISQPNAELDESFLRANGGCSADD